MERKNCEFFLVRYVPDRVKSEFVNIGVLLRERGEDQRGETVLRFTRDWRRVRCLDPDADIPLFEALESELRQRLTIREEGVKPILDVIEDTWSNSLQLTPSKGCLAENLAAEMDQLMRLYVESRKREAVSRQSGRQAIYGSMRSHFERAGVWDMLDKRIPIANYTRRGDPLRIDCGYKPNGVIRMFHAVSLEGDVEFAKVLAFSAQGLREGLKRREQAELQLTAIVQPLGAWEKKDASDDGERLEQYRFAVETMERETIRVLTTSDLPRIAEAARRELGV